MPVKGWHDKGVRKSIVSWPVCSKHSDQIKMNHNMDFFKRKLYRGSFYGFGKDTLWMFHYRICLHIKYVPTYRGSKCNKIISNRQRLLCNPITTPSLSPVELKSVIMERLFMKLKLSSRRAL